jgi:hypothetical protein
MSHPGGIIESIGVGDAPPAAISSPSEDEPEMTKRHAHEPDDEGEGDEKEEAELDEKEVQQVSSEYELLRLAKIARNMAKLRELGLLDDTMKPQGRSKPRRRRRRGSEETLRRSKRLQMMLSRGSDKVDKEHSIPRAVSSSSSRPPLLHPVAAYHVQGIELDVKTLIDHFLGREKQDFLDNKAKVVSESARVAVQSSTTMSDENQRGMKISFNKYSSVLEWSGSTFFLWINFAVGVGPGVSFVGSGRRVHWFGGSMIDPKSPLTGKMILRLVAAGGKKGKGTRDVGSCVRGGNVVLWCRRYCADRNDLTPYACLGRLKVRPSAIKVSL